MNIKNIPNGKKVPDDLYAIIEIPAYSLPVKYEINKDLGVLFVDRFIATSMFYPCNYGYINNTLALDGDPMDVLVPTPYPLQSKTVIRCRPIGLLKMTDESGIDLKLIAVPHSKITKEYDHIYSICDLPILLKKQIQHFFQNYKQLESKKWVSIDGWEDVNISKKEITLSVERALTKSTI
ncbi:MAG: inorganic diphosphatase [Arsenophonus sp.]|nr:MAG: inorganic diphosphatase [Arsenophonus sp.]